MTDFKTKKVQSEDLGEYLASCRQRANFSPYESAKFSGVQLKFIEALEAGRLRDLPAAVYVRGFLRSLCRLYRIEAGSVLERFAAEAELLDSFEAFPSASPAPREKWLPPRFVLTPKVLTILGVSVFALLSLAYLYFQVSSLRRAPLLELTSPAADGQSFTSHLAVSGRAEPGASVYINDQPVASDTDGQFAENLSLAPGTNQITVKAKNKFGRETVVTRSVALRAEKQIAGIASAVVLEVAVSDEDARITVAADGQEVFSGTILAGAVQRFSAENRIVLGSSNAGATRVSLNGRDLGFLGKKGEALQNIEFVK